CKKYGKMPELLQERGKGTSGGKQQCKPENKAFPCGCLQGRYAGENGFEQAPKCRSPVRLRPKGRYRNPAKPTFVKREVKIGRSRFDADIMKKKSGNPRSELKGVTLQEDGVATFPDSSE
ncbi:MAG: DNA/RNA nuclease SfsA, partial [Anaerotignum sp.]